MVKVEVCSRGTGVEIPRERDAVGRGEGNGRRSGEASRAPPAGPGAAGQSPGENEFGALILFS